MSAFELTEDIMIPECTGLAGGVAYMSRVLDDQWTSLTY
jgi:hypothetical protein